MELEYIRDYAMYTAIFGMFSFKSIAVYSNWKGAVSHST